eukprot:2024360-Prymnesium_polylepis.1
MPRSRALRALTTPDRTTICRLAPPALGCRTSHTMSSHGLTGGRAPPSAPLDAPYPAKPLSKLLSTQPSPLRQ